MIINERSISNGRRKVRADELTVRELRSTLRKSQVCEDKERENEIDTIKEAIKSAKNSSVAMLNLSSRLKPFGGDPSSPLLASHASGEKDISGLTAPVSAETDWIAMIILLLSLVHILPVIWGADFLLGKDIVNLTSPNSKILVVSSLAVCLPLSIDLLLDAVFIGNVKYLYLRLLSLIGIILNGVVYLLASHLEFYATVQRVMGFTEVFIEFACGLWLLHALDKTGVWTSNRILFIIFTYTAADYFNYFSYIDYYTDHYGILDNFDTAFTFISLGVFAILSGLWVYNRRKDLFRWKAPSMDDSYCLIIMNCTLLTFIAFFLMPTVVFHTTTVTPLTFEISSEKFQGSIVIRTMYALALCILPARIFKTHALENEYDLKVKHLFVQYMSHEMRYIPVFGGHLLMQ